MLLLFNIKVGAIGQNRYFLCFDSTAVVNFKNTVKRVNHELRLK